MSLKVIEFGFLIQCPEQVIVSVMSSYYCYLTLWYRDGAGNIVEKNSSVFSLIRMR